MFVSVRREGGADTEIREVRWRLHYTMVSVGTSAPGGAGETSLLLALGAD
jgi:hypothetical protein